MIFANGDIDFSLILNDEIIALLAYGILYLSYYFGSDFILIKKISMKFNESKENIEKSIYLRRVLGFVLLGLVPFFLALFYFEGGLLAYGLGFPSGQYAWIWFLVPFVLTIAISILRPSSKIDISYYPEVRKEKWTTKRLIINALFWAIYLLGYEFGLRGMIFFTTLHAFGLWPAIIINSVIYAFVHIFKGPGEAFGAFFLGILFCLITYFTNSFWIVFLIHTAMAIINDVKAVRVAQQNNKRLGNIKNNP